MRRKYQKNRIKYGTKLRNYLGKNFDSEPVYNDKSIKTEINLDNTNFYGNKTPREHKHSFL